MMKKVIAEPSPAGARGRRERPVQSRNPQIQVEDGRPDVNLGIMGELVAFRLRYVSGVSNQCFADRFAPPGYTPKQYSTAYLIAQNPGINLTTLASVVGVDPSTLILTVDYLEERGWITRTRSPPDRRVVALTITPRGASELAEGEKRMKECDDFLTRSLDRDERETLDRVLEKIARSATGGT